MCTAIGSSKLYQAALLPSRQGASRRVRSFSYHQPAPRSVATAFPASANYLRPIYPPKFFLANLKDSLAVDTQKSNPTTQGAATPRLSRGTVIAVAVSYLSLHRGIAVQSDETIQPAWEQELDASNALTTLSQKPPVEENESECSISTSSRGNPATIPCQASRKKMQTEWCQGCNLEWI